MTVYNPDEDLAMAGESMTSGDIEHLISHELAPSLTLDQLKRLKAFCERRITAIEKANGKFGWWRVRFSKNPEQLLNEEEKILLLGIKHPKFNPKGQKNKIMAIKRLRERESYLLKESKELVDAYILRVEAGDAEPPATPSTISPTSVPDFKALEGELL